MGVLGRPPGPVLGVLSPRVALLAPLLLGACAGPGAGDDGAGGGGPGARASPERHVPSYAGRPFEPFWRANAVAIALREWRAFGGAVNDDPPDTRVVPLDWRPDRQPGLWQRVGDYWWFGQDAETAEAGSTGKYNRWGMPYEGEPTAWSAAFVSYVMRAAGADGKFLYSPTHSDYINAAASGLPGLAAERPEVYAPRIGDLICTGRDGSQGMRFDALPTGRFPSHCDIVVEAKPGQLKVVGGNVAGGVGLKHVPTTQTGTLAGPDGVPLDSRYAWFVVLRVLYDDG